MRADRARRAGAAGARPEQVSAGRRPRRSSAAAAVRPAGLVARSRSSAAAEKRSPASTRVIGRSGGSRAGGTARRGRRASPARPTARLGTPARPARARRRRSADGRRTTVGPVPTWPPLRRHRSATRRGSNPGARQPARRRRARGPVSSFSSRQAASRGASAFSSPPWGSCQLPGTSARSNASTRPSSRRTTVTTPARKCRLPTSGHATEGAPAQRQNGWHGGRRGRNGRSVGCRAASACHDWQQARAGFLALRARGPLAASDMEALAEAAWWEGAIDESLSAYEEAYRLYLHGDSRSDARRRCWRWTSASRGPTR